MFSQEDGLSGDMVSAIFEDHEGNIWISTIEGLHRFRDPAVATFSTKQGLSNNVVGSVLGGEDGSVWVGTYGGLNRWDHGRIVTPPTGGPTETESSMAPFPTLCLKITSDVFGFPPSTN